MVLFGGFSAGARGAMVTIDFLHEVLPPSTTIKGFMDSGAYQVSLQFLVIDL